MTDGTVTAVDLPTGAPRWDLGGVYSRSEVVETGGDTVLVRVAAGSDLKGKLLTVGGGLEIVEADRNDYLDFCATDGALFACPDDDGLVVVHDLVTGRATKTGVEALAVDRIHDGRIFVSTTDRAWSIDAAGNVIDADLPGEPVTITEDHIYFGPFTNNHDTASLSCYALQGA